MMILLQDFDNETTSIKSDDGLILDTETATIYQFHNEEFAASPYVTILLVNNSIAEIHAGPAVALWKHLLRLVTDYYPEAKKKLIFDSLELSLLEMAEHRKDYFREVANQEGLPF